jgi:hypothetical protein
VPTIDSFSLNAALRPFDLAMNAKEVDTQTLAALAIVSSVTAALSLAVDDTADHLINATESTAVAFTVSGLTAGETGAVTFTDSVDHQVSVDVVANGNYSANLSALTDGTIASLLSVTDPRGASTSTDGNAVSLDTDSALTPSLSVDAANPSDVHFTVSGLESDYSGTVTFTESSGKSDVGPIGSNGAYSANLSNLANGTITYLTTVSDAAGNVINVDPTVTLGDGSANAPAGTPQLPNLLSGEAVRPPWTVAGVDYAVGISAGTVLKDPTTAPLPAGCTFIANYGGYPTVRVSGNNVVLSGYDFSLHGGINVYIASSTNTTITNSNFHSASSSGVIYMDGASSGLNLTNNVMDGVGATPGAANSLLYAVGGGNITLQYNLFENMPAQAVSFLGSTNLVMQYNLFENGGEEAPNHLNFMQFAGNNATNTALVEYNTVYQQVQASNGEGFQFYNNGTGSNLAGATVAYNTMVADTTNSNATIRQSNHAYNIGDVITVAGVKGYFFCTGAGTSASSVPSAETSFTMAQFGVTFSDGTAKFIGNSQAMSYMLHGSGAYATTTTLTAPAQLYQNYFDPRGAYGVFYANSFPGWTISNNVDMATGKIIQVSNSEVSPTTVTKVVSSPSSGIELPGNTITLTLSMSGAITVSGTPTLSLSDGGTATYIGGSGTNALTFSYIVSASDTSVPALAVTQFNLPSGATVIDRNGNTPNLSGAVPAPKGYTGAYSPGGTPLTPYSTDSLPQSDQGPGLNVVAPNGVSTRTVKAVPCSTAARETDGSTTCVGIPAKRARANRR